jgi:polysaccharide biosynthesis/export protein
MAIVFSMAIFSCIQTGFSQIDPTLLKLKELASSSSLNIGKGSSPAPGGFLDNSINPEGYFIGGGDVFGVHIVELPSVEYFVVVDQNCDAVIPDLGIVRLGKKTLTQAKTILRDFIRSKLKKPYEVYVSLVRAKSAIITVSGAISNPGTFQVEGTYRLFDVITLANNRLLPSISEFNFREVKCTHQDTSESFDLFRFLFLGDNSQNPYVYPGDQIDIKLARRRVFISGSLRNQYLGFLPIKPNETAKDFLSLFNFDCSADTGKILITKYEENNVAKTVVFSLKEPGAITLDDRDVIVVPPRSGYPQHQIVQVSGEINRPGTYPIQSQKTDAMTIIEQAGGPTPRGNMKRAFVFRRIKIEALEKAMHPPSNTQVNGVPIQRTIVPGVRPEIAAALSNVTTSKDFSIIPLKDNAKQVLLFPEDEVVVPKLENVVYLSGNVKAPGAYPFIEGKNEFYYIQEAGGLTSRADKSNVFVMIQYGDAYQVKGKASIEDGDIIIVPESQQYKFLTVVVLPIISVFLTALSTAFVIYSVTK